MSPSVDELAELVERAGVLAVAKATVARAEMYVN